MLTARVSNWMRRHADPRTTRGASLKNHHCTTAFNSPTLRLAFFATSRSRSIVEVLSSYRGILGNLFTTPLPRAGREAFRLACSYHSADVVFRRGPPALGQLPKRKNFSPVAQTPRRNVPWAAQKAKQNVQQTVFPYGHPLQY